MSNTPKKENMRSVVENGVLIAIVLLSILLLVSLVLLTVRLVNYSKIDERELSLKSNMFSDLSIFAVTYRNDSGDIIVQGQNGEKVIAPGYSVDYNVYLRNTDDVAIDYTIEPKVTFTSEYELPIKVRVLDSSFNYLIGDDQHWVKIQNLNGETIAETLGEDKTAEYIFQWKWDFESGNDELDSQLGASAVDQAIGVEVVFSVTALTNTSYIEKGGIFGDGAFSTAATYTFIPLLIAALVFLIVYVTKSKKKHAAETAASAIDSIVE